jgi:hypothetical protein
MACCGENWLVPGADPNSGVNSGVQSVTAGTPNVTMTGTLQNPIVNVADALVPRPPATIFVSQGGNNLTADGSISNPFATIQAAISYRNLLSLTANVEIYIYSGNYTENLTINVGNTYFTGPISPYKDVKTVIINGIIRVDITNLTGQGTVEVGFNNILFTALDPQGIITGSTVEQGLAIAFNNCNLSSSNQHNQSTVTGVYTVRYFNCYMTWNGAGCIVQSVGCQLEITRCDLLHTSSTINPVINMQNGNGGSAGFLVLQYSLVRSSTTNLISPQPIIRFQNTAASNANSIMHNSLFFTSSNVDTGGNKCCIQFNQTGAITFQTVAYNVFECDGANFTGGSPGPQTIQLRNTGTVNLGLFAGNYAGSAAQYVAAGITRSNGILLT